MKNKKGIVAALISAIFLVYYFADKGYFIFETLFKKGIYFCLSILDVLFFSSSKFFVLVFVISFVFGLGVAIFELIRVLKLKAQFKKRRREINGRLLVLIKSLNLKDKVVLIDDKRPFAMVLGFFFPKIYISTGLIEVLGKEELEAVLYHEQAHLRFFDNLVRFILSFFVYALPFYILAKPIFEKFKAYQEIRADKYTVEKLRNKKPVVLALRKIVSCTPSFTSSYTGFVEERIDALKGNLKVSWANIFLLAFFVIPVLLLPLKAQGKEGEYFCVKGSECWHHCVVNTNHDNS